MNKCRGISIFVALFLGMMGASVANGDIFHDDFDGPVLGSEWVVKLGNAWTEDGWAVLQHLPGGVGPRDTIIVADEGGDWTDYRVKTRFVAEGGGNNWYRAHLYFRVADVHGWPATGSYYAVSMVTPIYGSSEGPGIGVYRIKNGVYTSLGQLGKADPELQGVFDNFDNTIEVEADGDHIRVWANKTTGPKTLMFDLVDPDPISEGGVGLGAVWESRTRFDYVSVRSLVTTVEIDVKPGGDLNSINPESKAKIPVAILATNTGDGDLIDFDPTQVDPLSVEFGPNGASEIHGRGHIEDVDGDGDPDLVLHFKTQQTGIVCGDTAASLTGETFSGNSIEGTDSINTVGCQ
jgi:hypothetical protein